jgi:predicted negative regulator of RcsB-dependent stress response
MASTLEPDVQPSHPLSRGSDDRAGDWLRANGRAVGVGIALIVAAAIGSVLWRSTERGKADRAERAFFEAQAAAQGEPAAAERALRPLVSRYDGTAGGAQALLLLVQSLYDQGKYQDGLTALGGSKVPDEFADGVQLLRAAGLEGAGRPAEAAKLYEQLAGASDVVPRRRDELRAAAARAHEVAGDRAAALRLWQQIVTANASQMTDEARVRVGELSAAR